MVGGREVGYMCMDVCVRAMRAHVCVCERACTCARACMRFNYGLQGFQNVIDTVILKT